MATIHILAPHEAQKIAAGEVLERPASAIKELVENALDAGATSIRITVEQGGKQSIIVEDNGSGMSAEDARLSVINHATSKISSIQELTTIATFGFRGEALASIAAASTLTIRTKTHDAPLGIELRFENGACTTEASVACQPGTRIQVEDIFSAIPVRKKFLKKDETEWRAIQQLVTAFALAHPKIEFTVTHNDRHILHAPPHQTLHERFCTLLGLDLREYTVALANENAYANVHGLITKASKTRYDRNHIFVFVNQRWIKNYKLAQALVKGYDNILLPQHFPLAALFITVPDDAVDINIHPRKEEVQFMHPIGVERCVEVAVRQALEQEIKATLQATAAFNINEKHLCFALPIKPSTQKKFQQSCEDVEESIPTIIPDQSLSTIVPQTPCSETLEPQKKPEYGEPIPIAQNQQQLKHTEYNILGQLHATYILIQTVEGLLLIDQHAAHERILFEQFRDRMHRAEKIDLLFPQIAHLKEEEFQALIPHLNALDQQGITLEVFGECSLMVRALPVPMKSAPVADFLQEIAQHLLTEEINYPKNIESLYEKLHATMACKAAVKAGDILNAEEMQALVYQIITIDQSTTCPHGRPTTWHISLRELERKFQRTL